MLLVTNSVPLQEVGEPKEDDPIKLEEKQEIEEQMEDVPIEHGVELQEVEDLKEDAPIELEEVTVNAKC